MGGVSSTILSTFGLATSSIDEKKKTYNANRYDGPINSVLQARNVVAMAGGLYFLVAMLDSYEAIRSDFKASYNAISPAPCAIATPSLSVVYETIGKTSEFPLPGTRFRDRNLQSSVRSAICNAPEWPTSAVVSMFLDHQTTYTEASATDAICAKAVGTADYGDILNRVQRAYTFANPAFVKYSTTTCIGTYDPFLEAGCANSALIKTLLSDAASSSMLGGESRPAALTPLRMLVAVLALGVVGEYDRSFNNNLCFENAAKLNATRMCEIVYGLQPDVSATVSPPPPPPALTALYGETGYEASLQRSAPMCTQYSSAGLTPTTISPSPPPPGTDYKFTESIYGSNAQTPAITGCRDVHTWGLLDHRRALGVPDPSIGFQWENLPAEFFAHILWSGVGSAKINELNLGINTNPINNLRLYQAYKFASATMAMSLLLAPLGVYLGLGSVPFLVFMGKRLLRSKSVVTETVQTMLTPPPGSIMTFIQFTAALGWAWAFFFDPVIDYNAQFPVSAECQTWSDQSVASVWRLAEHRSRDLYRVISIWIYLLVIVTTFVSYIGFFRDYGVKKQRKERVRFFEPRDQLIWLSIVFQFLAIFCAIQVAAASGNNYFDEVINQPVSGYVSSIQKARVDMLVDDLTDLLTVSLFAGLNVSILLQRWVVMQENASYVCLYIAAVVLSVVFPAIIGSYKLYENKTDSNSTTRRDTWLIIFDITVALNAGVSAFVSFKLTSVDRSGTSSTEEKVEVDKDAAGQAQLAAQEASVEAEEASVKKKRSFFRPFRFRSRQNRVSPSANGGSSSDDDPRSYASHIGEGSRLLTEARLTFCGRPLGVLRMRETVALIGGKDTPLVNPSLPLLPLRAEGQTDVFSDCSE